MYAFHVARAAHAEHGAYSRALEQCPGTTQPVAVVETLAFSRDTQESASRARLSRTFTIADHLKGGNLLWIYMDLYGFVWMCMHVY